MTVKLSPIGGVAGQFFDNNGDPLTGGKIFTYAAGTTTPQVTYTSSTSSAQHTNPIILDAAGRVPGGEMWLTDGLSYKFVIKTSADTQIGTYDNIVGINASSINYTSSQEIQTASAGQTVFTLTTMQYQPNTNSLTVFVDGINQYGPGAAYAFTETNSTTVTFNTGLSLGAKVKFTTTQLNAASYGDAEQISYTPTFTGSVSSNVEDKLSQIVNVLDFGADPTGINDSTPAFQAAITFLLNRFNGGSNYYTGNPVNWRTADLFDRRTGRIYVPAGRYKVTNNVFSGVINPRAIFCGMEFIGDHRLSSVLDLQTNGTESWFFNNESVATERFQRIWWKNLEFRSDNYLYGNVLKQYSIGGPKQFRFSNCNFVNLQKFIQCEGAGNADLTKVEYCTGEFYGDMLTLNNSQAVQHDFIGNDLGCYGHYIRVMANGGGNVNITNSSIDWIWLEDVSPATGNYFVYLDDNANMSIGNCTVSFRDCRVEVEAYKKTASGNPPLGLVYAASLSNESMPRVVFDNVNFVNGQTYQINGVNQVIGSASYKRITAVKISRWKNIVFRDCVLLKNFFYEIAGSNNAGSPPYGGLLRFENCFDGIIGELPAGDSGLVNLHSRVTYTDTTSSTAGRTITCNMVEHSGGSPYQRKVLDSDPRWDRGFAREPSSSKRITNIKPKGYLWPVPGDSNSEFTVDLPPDFFAFRLYLRMDASGVITSTYQLFIGSNDKSVIVGQSTLAQLKDQHLIDLSHVDLSAYTTLRVWATGTATSSRSDGISYIEHV